jgi:undecaprenyl diphosphate synthase
MEQMNNENLPKHIAIILDGNRRWAKRERTYNIPRTYCRI